MAISSPRKAVDELLEKYGIPAWVKPYIYRYIRGNPIQAIKHAASFVEIKRKKGEVTNSHVKLPNGMKFDIKFVMHLLDMFYYGEEEISKIYAEWSADRLGADAVKYAPHFVELSEVSQGHARAVRNLIEGLGNKLSDPSKETKEVFGYIRGIKDWKQRVVVSGLIMRKTYGIPFGYVFYKVFYPVAPEFMRSFGKVFEKTSEIVSWGESEASSIISSKSVDEPELAATTEHVLAYIYKSISAEMPYAKKQGIEPEGKLLLELAIAYPLHAMQELGMKIDIDAEIEAIKKLSKEV